MTKIAITILVVASMCTAQDKSIPRGNLVGVVVDAAGAALPGAKVTISGSSGTRVDRTNQNGQFLFPLLRPDSYRVMVKRVGFKSAEMQDTEVLEDKISAVSITLVAGDPHQTILVKSNAVVSAVIRDSIDQKLMDRFYEAVPLKNRPQPIIDGPGVSDPNAPKSSSDKKVIVKDLDGIPHGRSVGDIIEMY